MDGRLHKGYVKSADKTHEGTVLQLVWKGDCMEARIIFKNGVEITAEKNGDCFIVARKPAFPTDLSVVTVTDSDGEKTIRNVQVIECAAVDENYWFAFRELSEEEAWRAGIEDALCELSMEE